MKPDVSSNPVYQGLIDVFEGSVQTKDFVVLHDAFATYSQPGFED